MSTWKRRLIWSGLWLVFLTAFVFLIYIAGNITDVDWIKWSQIATIVNTIATIVYIFAFSLALHYARKQLNEIQRQVTEMQHTRVLEAGLALFEETRKRPTVDTFRSIYAIFCENGFKLHPDRIPAPLREQIIELVRVLSRVGSLMQDSVFVPSAVFVLHADFFLRCWIILEEYIEAERKKRGDLFWQAPVQYLAILSLKVYLHRGEFYPSQNEGSDIGLIFFHPKADFLPETRKDAKKKVYKNSDLNKMHERLEKDWTNMQKYYQKAESVIRDAVIKNGNYTVTD